MSEVAVGSKKSANTSPPHRVRQFSLIAISVSSLVAIAAIGNLIYLKGELLKWQNQTRRSRVAVETLKDTLQILTDAETGVRGYAFRATLKGKPDENYLEPFEQANQRFPANLKKVKELVADDAAQVQRYQALDRSVRDRMQHLQLALDTFNSVGPNNLAAQLDEGKRQMDRFREAQRQIIQVEHQKVDTGLKRYIAIQARQTWWMNTSGICLGIIAITIAWEIWRTIRQERDRVVLAQSEMEAAQCEVRVLENASEARAKTAAALAHDIKHWLQPIQSSCEMLELYRSRYPERIPKWIERIKAGVASIDRLAKETVLVFQADAGQLKPDREPTNLVQLLQSAIEDIQTRQHRIAFSLAGTPHVVLIDRGLIDRAIRNLLNNAIKYSPNGGQIHVLLEFAKCTAIVVADQGIGIPEDKRANLFQEFHRAENVGGIPGSGLGLAVVRAAAIVHGGNVFVESEEGLRISGVDEEFRTMFRLELDQ